jgi:hypothetical protein
MPLGWTGCCLEEFSGPPVTTGWNDTERLARREEEEEEEEIRRTPTWQEEVTLPHTDLRSWWPDANIGWALCPKSYQCRIYGVYVATKYFLCSIQGHTVSMHMVLGNSWNVLLRVLCHAWRFLISKTGWLNQLPLNTFCACGKSVWYYSREKKFHAHIVGGADNEPPQIYLITWLCVGSSSLLEQCSHTFF